VARILLVEDEPDIGEVLDMALSGEGYIVDLVTTATEALSRLRAIKYELVISDWRLPDGGDGMLVVGKAADLGSKTMVMSGYLFQLGEPDKRHEYLMKPLRPSELVKAVKQMIGPP